MNTTIDTHKIGVYTASAGSGKTYTLTRVFIRLAVGGADDRWQARQAAAVLAITFTNAAAADMKRKIMETLAAVASGEDAAEDLQADTGLPAGLLRQRSEAVLHYLLHDYGNFSVQTIDSFVQRVIRPFAFELGLPRTYETDIETGRWVEEIREALLEAYGLPQQEVLTEILDGFLEEIAENEDKGRMEVTPALNAVLALAFEEQGEARLKRLADCDDRAFLQTIEGFVSRRHACEKTAAAIYKEMQALLQAERLEAADFYEKTTGFWSFFKNRLTEKSVSGREVLRDFVAGESKTKWRKTVEKGFLSDPSRAEAAARLQTLYDKMQALDAARYLYEAALEKHLYALALMKRADALKDRMQQAEGRVPISEFNRKIHALLGQTDVPYLYERVGAVYRHILVDEFQDTSALQWENLLPLIDNNRASGYWNMVVGDPKQSIYRFRAANVEQMLALRENTDLAQNEKLESNWRSDTGIIAFNNLFYHFLKEDFKPEKPEVEPEWQLIQAHLQRVYRDHEQFYKTRTDSLPAEDARAVRVCFYSAADAKAAAARANEELAQAVEAGVSAADEVERVEPEDYDSWNCRQIEAILRRHDPGDVAVLCTRNTSVESVAAYLVERGVKVHTDSSLLLRTSLTVRLLVAALRYMDAPDSATARLKLAWFFRQMAVRRGEDWQDGQSEARCRYLKGLAHSGRSLYDKLQHILRAWELRAETDQYILSFLDLVQQSGLRTEADFVREWENRWQAESRLQTSAGQSDAVRVTTVHKSKGLEYPVVIYAFASDAPRTDGWVWTDLAARDALPVGLLSVTDALGQTVDEAAVAAAAEEQVKAALDRINVLYVTTTRPRHKLYVLSKTAKGSHKFAENRYWERFTEQYPAYLADETEWTADEPAAGPAPDASRPQAAAAVDPLPVQPRPSRTFSDWMERFEPAFSWREAAKSPERIWGDFIHALLGRVTDRNRYDRAVMAAYIETRWPDVAAQAGGHTPADALAQVEAVLAHPSLQACFSAEYRIYNERELCCDGQIFRPDRVAVGEREIYVLDYKTGEERPEHVRQVAVYRDWLNRKEGKPVHACLVYIGNQDVRVKDISDSETA